MQVSSTYVTPSNTMNVEPSAPSPTVDNAQPSRDAVEQVRAWLDKRVRIELTDGRVIEGALECFDKLGNMILGEAYELRETGNRFPLGLVLAPQAAMRKIRVGRSVPSAADRLIDSLSIGDTL